MILILLSGDIPYTRDIESGFTSELTIGLTEKEYIARCVTVVGVPDDNADEENSRIVQSAIAKVPEQRIDYLVTVGTSVSRFAYRHYFGVIPLIFAGVTDPVASGLVRSYKPDDNRGKIAGVDYGISYLERIKLFAECFPGTKFGFVYNPAFNADVVVKETLIKEMRNYPGIEIVFIEVNKPYLTPEQSGLAQIFFGHFGVAKDFSSFMASTTKPFIGGTNQDTLLQGALMQIGNDDDKNIGRIAAKEIVLRNLLDGIPLHAMPIQTHKVSKIRINLAAFRKHDIGVPCHLETRSDVAKIGRY